MVAGLLPQMSSPARWLSSPEDFTWKLSSPVIAGTPLKLIVGTQPKELAFATQYGVGALSNPENVRAYPIPCLLEAKRSGIPSPLQSPIPATQNPSPSPDGVEFKVNSRFRVAPDTTCTTVSCLLFALIRADHRP